jgi:hypothetical protein
MRTIIKLVPLALIGGAVAVQVACSTTVPTDVGAGNALAPGGVIRGNVFYNGPPPCTQNGQVVGNAVILVFDRRNPPPPAGLANTATNFGVISGDLLFANVPRTTGTTLECPLPGAASISASGPFAISPMEAGSYVIQAFYDTTGDFLPQFKFRNLPEAMDVGGGYIDVNDAEEYVPSNQASSTLYIDAGAGLPLLPYYPPEQKSANPSYAPIFLPVDIGTPGAVPTGSVRDVPTFTMPPTGFVADNISVNIASSLTLARPYFYPEGVYGPVSQKTKQILPNPNPGVVIYGSSATRPTTPVKTPENPDGNVDFVPVLSFPQDIQVYATPNPSQFLSADPFQSSFPQVSIHWGVPAAEAFDATDTTKTSNPFHMQLANPAAPGAALGGNGGLYIFGFKAPDGVSPAEQLQLEDIPEGTIPRLWPLVVLAKLDDDPTHTLDPEDVTYQGSDLTKPIVIIQGITLFQDSIFNSVVNENSILLAPDFASQTNLFDHVTAMLRPNVVCLDPRHTDLGGTIVTPYQCAPYPPGDNGETQISTCPAKTATQAQQGPVLNVSQIIANPQLAQILNPNPGVMFGCLPTGRYGINVVYPSGQAWTTPNESGACAQIEGGNIFGKVGTLTDPGSCSLKSRPVLYSQGTRAIVEITPTTSGACKTPNPSGIGTPGPVPSVCTTLTGD